MNKKFALKSKKIFNENFIYFSVFSLYGIFANISSFLLYFILAKIFFITYQFSYIISTSTMILINFFVYEKIFKSFANFNTLIKYLLVQIFTCIVHFVLIIILVEKFNFNQYFSHIVSNIFLSINIFFIYKFYVYTNK